MFTVMFSGGDIINGGPVGKETKKHRDIFEHLATMIKKHSDKICI